MIPQRIVFLSDLEEVPAIDLDLLDAYRSDIEKRILTDGTDNTYTIPVPGDLRGAFLTSIPKPKIGRIDVRWFLSDDEEAVVTGVRSGQSTYETPPDEEY